MHANENKTTNTAGASTKSAASKFPFFQPKLTINEPGDQYEQEADRMADHVMRMPSGSAGEGRGEAFFKPSPLSISRLQRKCQNCEDDEKLHRKENSTQPTEASSETSSYISSLSSKGSPLPEGTRSFFEPRFGQDFSNVKIHKDVEATKSANSINALAYTSGNNIVFNQNQFSPESNGGKKLLAHELTHVVQQRDMLQTSNIQCKSSSKSANTKKSQIKNVDFSGDVIDGMTHEKESPIIKKFFSAYSAKLLNFEQSSMAGLQNFETSMKFPEKEEGEVSFKSMAWNLAKEGFEKLILPALKVVFPEAVETVEATEKVITFIKIITKAKEEIETAEKANGERNIKDFLITTRNLYSNTISKMVDSLTGTNSIKMESDTQKLWYTAPTQVDKNKITGAFEEMLNVTTPSAEEFQKQVITAYILSNNGEFENNALAFRDLGRITVLYDESNKFTSATVQVRSSDGGSKVAEQINKLFVSPSTTVAGTNNSKNDSPEIDLRKIGVEISMMFYGPGIAGGDAYYGVVLEPPDYIPSSNINEIGYNDIGYKRFMAFPGDPFIVNKIS